MNKEVYFINIIAYYMKFYVEIEYSVFFNSLIQFNEEIINRWFLSNIFNQISNYYIIIYIFLYLFLYIQNIMALYTLNLYLHYIKKSYNNKAIFKNLNKLIFHILFYFFYIIILIICLILFYFILFFIKKILIINIILKSI